MEEDDFVEVCDHFKYLIAKSTHKLIFKENIKNDILVDIDDSDDLKINNFIKDIISSYPLYFNRIKEKNTRDNIKDKLMRTEKRNKKTFLIQIENNDLISAADTLLGKKIINSNNDTIIDELNNLMNIDFSNSDLHNFLIKDINHYLNVKKINILELAKYLKKEIILILEEKEYNLDEGEEIMKFLEEERKFLIYKLIKSKTSVELFWENY